MIRSTAIVIFISLAVSCTLTYAQDPASALMEKLSDNVDLQALNAAEQVQNLKNQVKTKCDTNAGPGQYEKLFEAMNNMQECVKNLVNVTQLHEEIEEAKPKGNLDVVFEKYCRKRTTLTKCMADFTSVLNPCLEPLEQESTKIIQNVTHSLLEFICYKEGDRIALFIAARGPECFQSKQQPIQDCLNSTFGSYIPAGATEGITPSLETLPKLAFGEKECSDMDKLRECSVKALEECSDPTPGNIADALFTFVKRVTPCERVLNAKSMALQDERLGKSGSETTIAFNIHTIILLVSTLTLAYI